MKIPLLIVVLLFSSPVLRAQQPENEKSSTPATQPVAGASLQNKLPDSTKTAHPLDPADVDVLTGKRDRQIEDLRRERQIILGGYGGGYGVYPGGLGVNSDFTSTSELPLLPLRTSGSSFFFSSIAPRGFRSRRFARRGGTFTR